MWVRRPCRIGNVARSLVPGEPKHVRFLFGHELEDLSQLATFMTDRAYLGGVQGFPTDDVRLFDAHRLARESGLAYGFEYAEPSPEEEAVPPHATRIEVEDVTGARGELVAASIGGGMIRISRINGFPVDWRSDTYALLIAGTADEVTPERIAQFEHVYDDEVLAGTLIDARPPGFATVDGVAAFIETSRPFAPEEVAAIFPHGNLTVLPALLPVVTTKRRRPQLFTTVEEWRSCAHERDISFVQAAIEYEKAFSGWDEDRIWAYFERIASILHRQVHALEEIGYENVVDTPMLPVYGRWWDAYAKRATPLSDSLTSHIIVHALSTNAKIPGVLIVPGPMGTGGGYLFSALDAVREHHGFSHERLIESLVAAAGLGALAYTHTNASGEVGCVGESGVCCAMASGAVTWLAGGDGTHVEHAASMALQANMGLTCDPIPGGLEFPCLTRTVRAAVSAPLYADLALSGIDPLIPYHEVLQAIEDHRQQVDPALLCGSECGCNQTATAKRCKEGLTRLMAGQLSS